MTVKVGIAGWIDKSLIDSKLFYPLNVKTSEERLNFYASQFSLVEVDSTYYGMPKPENSELWVARTPKDFTFDRDHGTITAYLWIGHSWAQKLSKLPP